MITTAVDSLIARVSADHGFQTRADAIRFLERTASARLDAAFDADEKATRRQLDALAALRNQ